MKKILIGGILAGLIILVIGMIFGAISSELYKMAPKILWKPMGGDWFTKIMLFDILSGFILAIVFSAVNKAIPGKGLIKGVNFGVLMFLVGPFLGLTMTYLTMAIRAKLIAMWALNNLVNYVLAGLLFEIIEEKIS